MRMLVLAAIAAAVGGPSALAAPPGEADTRMVHSAQFMAVNLAIRGQTARQKAGTGFFKDAREQCEKVKAMLARFDADAYWSARMEQCFGDVAAYEGNVKLACSHFSRARELLSKATGGGGDAELMARVARVRGSIDRVTKGRC